MRRLRAVAVKELRQVGRDPFSLLMLIALPALMLVLYGFALNFDVRHVKLAVQDRDRTARSRDLVASFTHSTYFDLVATPGPGTDLDALVERRVARAVLVIREGFGRDLGAGRRAEVQLLLDGRIPRPPPPSSGTRGPWSPRPTPTSSPRPSPAPAAAPLRPSTSRPASSTTRSSSPRSSSSPASSDSSS